MAASAAMRARIARTTEASCRDLPRSSPSWPSHSCHESTAYQDCISRWASVRASSRGGDSDGEDCRKSSCVSECNELRGCVDLQTKGGEGGEPDPRGISLSAAAAIRCALPVPQPFLKPAVRVQCLFSRTMSLLSKVTAIVANDALEDDPIHASTRDSRRGRSFPRSWISKVCHGQS